MFFHMVYKSFFHFVRDHAFDRQTDGQTEFSSLDRVCISCSAVKMVVNMEGLSYEERLRCLKLWTLAERRITQDVIEVFKISQWKSITGLQDLFTLDKNNKGTRGHTLKLSKMRCTRDCWKYFFSNRVVNRWNMLDRPADSWSYQRKRLQKSIE